MDKEYVALAAFAMGVDNDQLCVEENLMNLYDLMFEDFIKIVDLLIDFTPNLAFGVTDDEGVFYALKRKE